MWILGLKGVIQMPHYYGQFALSLGKEIALSFSLNSTHLTRTLSMTPLVSVSMGFDCSHRCSYRSVSKGQCGRVVSVLDSQSGGSGFESLSGHLLDLFSVVLSSKPGPRL